MTLKSHDLSANNQEVLLANYTLGMEAGVLVPGLFLVVTFVVTPIMQL